jgi:catechol 2,3-dioxygenase-like lactoylglutathione lyase family enzyme
VSDQGITHFCFRVDDVEAAHARLEAAGDRFHCEPLTFGSRAIATYARDPDGNVFELLQWLDGRD